MSELMKTSNLFNDLFWKNSLFGFPSFGEFPFPKTISQKNVSIKNQLTDNGCCYTIDLELGEADKNDVIVNVENNTLEIFYNKEIKTENSMSKSSFSYSVPIPDDVDIDNGISADSKDGMVTVKLMKMKVNEVEDTKVKRIEIK